MNDREMLLDLQARLNAHLNTGTVVTPPGDPDSAHKAFVTGLYETYLHRAPDPDGFAYWLDRARKESYAGVEVAFKQACGIIDAPAGKPVSYIEPAPDDSNPYAGVFSWPATGGSSVRWIDGPAGAILSYIIPVEPGFRGAIKIVCAGDRGQNQYGGHIDQLTFEVRSRSTGELLPTREGTPSKADKTGQATFEIDITEDVGALNATSELFMGGAGYMQLNVYPKA